VRDVEIAIAAFTLARLSEARAEAPESGSRLAMPQQRAV